MCYTGHPNLDGLQFSISNCFGVGFDWKDEGFRDAVNNRDERLWKILEWAANGGADQYNEAAEFEEMNMHYGYSHILSSLRGYERSDDLEAMRANPYLSQRGQKLIDLYWDGSLEDLAYKERQAEKNGKKKKSENGSVYLILAENGLYKIGKAKNVTTRLQPFSVHFPMKWELVHSFQCNNYSETEALLHQKYADKRDVGEWFRLEPADVDYIVSIQDGQL
jgi:Cft2 family RNA processing exonuclease